MPQRLRQPAAESRDAGVDVDQPHAVGAADAHAAFGKGANASPTFLASSVAALPEAGGKDDRRANSVRVGLIQNVAGGVGRRGDDDAVDRLWKIGDRWNALIAENVVVTRIDRKDRALETHTLEGWR